MDKARDKGDYLGCGFVNDIILRTVQDGEKSCRKIGIKNMLLVRVSPLRIAETLKVPRTGSGLAEH